MLPIVAYTDKLTVAPGESLNVMASSFGARTYRADFRRIIQGDTNPEGPGYKDELIPLDLGDLRDAIAKPFKPGSCVIVPGQGVLEHLDRFTLVAVIQPTLTTGKPRSILSLPGFAGLGLDADGHLIGWLGTTRLRIADPVSTAHWQIVSLSFDIGSGDLILSHLVDRSVASVALKPKSVSIKGSLERAGADECLIAATRDSKGELTGFFDGKIDRPAIFRDVVSADVLKTLLSEFPSLRRRSNLLAAWDFSEKMTSQSICDVSPYRLAGKTHNAPKRAMTGWLWQGQELDWKKRPELYSAIQFHGTDLYDAGWSVDFTISIPENIKSGVYAVRLVPDEVEDDAYYCVFVVRPPRDRVSGNTVAFLFPTCSYMAYANHRLGMDVPGTEIGMGRVVELDRHHMFLQNNPEIGFSLYEVHNDGTGVFHTSRLRPIVDMQPKVKSFLGGYGSNIWQFNADTHILGWLDHIGQEIDVITDEDVHVDGLRLLDRYNVIVTGTHPEYYTRNMIETVQAFADRGGRLMYLGGNGFYWVVSFNEDMPGIMECRRSEAGIRPWEPGHGQFYHGFTGEYGGLWRRNGHPPNHLCGVGMTSQGFDISEPYVINSDGRTSRTAFIPTFPK